MGLCQEMCQQMCHEFQQCVIKCVMNRSNQDTFLDTEKVCQECQITFVTDWLISQMDLGEVYYGT